MTESGCIQSASRSEFHLNNSNMQHHQTLIGVKGYSLWEAINYMSDLPVGNKLSVKALFVGLCVFSVSW